MYVCVWISVEYIYIDILMEIIWLIRLVGLRLTWPGFFLIMVLWLILCSQWFMQMNLLQYFLVDQIAWWRNCSTKIFTEQKTPVHHPTPQKKAESHDLQNDSIWGTDPRVVPRGLCSSAWLGGARLEGHGFERWCTTYILRVRKGLQGDGFEKCTADLVCLGKEWIYYIATSWSETWRTTRLIGWLDLVHVWNCGDSLADVF